MRYVMKQKIWTWGDDFTIRDEDGRDVYQVDGRAFSLGKKLSLLDMDYNELAFIRQKVLSWGATFEIERDGRIAAIVKKKLFTWLRCEFMVDVPGPDDLYAEGEFLEHEYDFFQHGRLVGTVSKQWFSWSDTYGVDLDDDLDQVLLLAATVVIDLCCHDSDD